MWGTNKHSMFQLMLQNKAYTSILNKATLYSCAPKRHIKHGHCNQNKKVQHQVVAANKSHMIPPPGEDVKMVIQAESDTNKTVKIYP